MQTADSLLEDWIALAGPDAEQLGRDLITRYQEPHRRYHTAEHLQHLLHAVDLLVEEGAGLEVAVEVEGPEAEAGAKAEAEAAARLAAVRFAAWFHDAVYEIGDGSALSNEERSAQLAEAVLTQELHASPELVAEVGRLVRLTADHHAGDEDRNGALLCDADLAILGANPDDYLRYCEQIRDEYRQYPDEVFRPGRAAVLSALLDPGPIYRTRVAQGRFEAAARRNLAAEIERLTAPVPAQAPAG